MNIFERILGSKTKSNGETPRPRTTTARRQRLEEYDQETKQRHSDIDGHISSMGGLRENIRRAVAKKRSRRAAAA